MLYEVGWDSGEVGICGFAAESRLGMLACCAPCNAYGGIALLGCRRGQNLALGEEDIGLVFGGEMDRRYWVVVSEGR